MRAFKVYRVCQTASGAFLERPLMCNDDDEALTIAKMTLRGLASAEVWQGSRLVGSVSSVAGWSVERNARSAVAAPAKAAPAKAAPAKAAPGEAVPVPKRTLVDTRG